MSPTGFTLGLTLVALTVAAAFVPTATAEEPNCDRFVSHGVFETGFFTIGFDFPNSVACITWCAEPEGITPWRGVVIEPIDQWSISSAPVPGTFNLNVDGPQLNWTGEYRFADSSVVWAEGWATGFLSLTSASTIPPVCA